MKIIFLLFICKVFSKDDDLAVNTKNVNRFFFINNAIGAVYLATLLSNHRAPKYLRIGFRIGSLFYFYNQYKHVDKAKLNYRFFHFYFPLVLNSAALLGEFFFRPQKKFLLSEILLSDFLLKNNTFFRIKKAIERDEKVKQAQDALKKIIKNFNNKNIGSHFNMPKQNIKAVKPIDQSEKNLKAPEKVAEFAANEFITSLLSSFVSLDASIYNKFHDAFCSYPCVYSKDYILLLKFDENHKVLINKQDAYDIKFYLVTNNGFFVSYIYIHSWRGILGNFFKTKNGEKGIGKKFFNWVIDFVRTNSCLENNFFDGHDCLNLFCGLKKIQLSTNKFLNKTALKIYKEKGFKVAKEHNNGEVELTLELSELIPQEKAYEFDYEDNKFLNNESELSNEDCFGQFLESISLNSCNEYATKNKRIESFVSQVLDYFIRFKKENSVDKINKHSEFLSYFRNRCIDEVALYLQFKGGNEDYLKKLDEESKEDALKEIENDSIENIEKDFREMLKSYGITITNLGNVELPQELLKSIECLPHFKE